MFRWCGSQCSGGVVDSAVFRWYVVDSAVFRWCGRQCSGDVVDSVQVVW